MEIRLGSLVEGARKAQGTAVIVDVFRAFTTAAIAFDRGAAEIILVAEVAEGLELRRQGVGDITMGEVGRQAAPRIRLRQFTSRTLPCTTGRQDHRPVHPGRNGGSGGSNQRRNDLPGLIRGSRSHGFGGAANQPRCGVHRLPWETAAHTAQTRTSNAPYTCEIFSKGVSPIPRP